MVGMVTLRSLECFNCFVEERVDVVTLKTLECFNWLAKDRLEIVTESGVL